MLNLAYQELALRPLSYVGTRLSITDVEMQSRCVRACRHLRSSTRRFKSEEIHLIVDSNNEALLSISRQLGSAMT